MPIITKIATLYPLNRITKPLRDSLYFCAPLNGLLIYGGLEACTFTRGSSGVVEERDAYLRTLGNNFPRFQYSNGILSGLLLEAAATNLCLRSDAFDNAAWVKTNVSVIANDAAAVDPFGTTLADSLTASAGNATVIQDLGAIASSSTYFGLWLKRKTGSGNIQLTLNNGAAWTTVAVTASWQRFSINATLANSDVGIRIVTSGDAVWAFGAMAQGSGATSLSSYIATTTATATRSADSLQYNAANNLSDGNTLLWLENGVAKVTPADANPFNAAGQWIGNTGVAVRNIVKASRVLTASEIAYAQGVLPAA